MITPAPTSRRAGALRRLGGATAAVAVGALVLAGCSSASAPSGDEAKDIVNLVTPAQPESLDPQISTDSIMGEITGPIFETLVTADADLQVQPMLAESYVVSDDSLEYTFTLRDGVKFQDGSDLDADDVVASMNRWTRVSVAAQEAFAGSEWTKVDDKNVKLTVTKKHALLKATDLESVGITMEVRGVQVEEPAQLPFLRNRFLLLCRPNRR